MKIYFNFYSMVVLLVSSIFASATPSYQEQTSETLIGANSEAFAVRRVETNNQGNYYRSQVKTFIDEYSKLDGKLIHSTLILDRILHHDAGHLDPNIPPKITTEVKHKDKKLVLSNLYE